MDTRVEARFRRDMQKAGYHIKEYRGRFFYEGPAVYTDERNGPTLQEVMSATRVPVQRDNLGLNWVVYPKG
jgi:hypothetical protein